MPTEWHFGFSIFDLGIQIVTLVDDRAPSADS
jgi:hypothetical protein